MPDALPPTLITELESPPAPPQTPPPAHSPYGGLPSTATPAAVASPGKQAARPRTAKSSAAARPKTLARLLARGPQFGFIQSVRYLQSLYPKAAQPGRSGPYRDERIRFRHSPSMSFSAGDIESVFADELEDGTERIVVQANFLGLSGVASPGPSYIAEELAQPGEGVEVQRAYFDLFHHRLYGLLYRGITQYDLPTQLAGDNREDWLSRLSCLAGFDPERNTSFRYLGVIDLLRIAPLLATRVRSAKVLEIALNRTLSEHLGPDTRCRIESFCGDWSELDEDARVYLGQANHKLGHSSVLGREIAHRAAKAKIVVETLSEHQFREFVRGGPAYGAIYELMQLMVDDPVDIEVNLRIQRQDNQSWRLGQSRLEIDSWLSGPQKAQLRTMQFELEAPPEADPQPSASD